MAPTLGFICIVGRIIKTDVQFQWKSKEGERCYFKSNNARDFSERRAGLCAAVTNVWAYKGDVTTYSGGRSQR